MEIVVIAAVVLFIWYWLRVSNQGKMLVTDELLRVRGSSAAAGRGSEGRRGRSKGSLFSPSSNPGATELDLDRFETSPVKISLYLLWGRRLTDLRRPLIWRISSMLLKD